MIAQKDYKIIRQCRCCRNGNLLEVLNFGEQPLANSFRSSENEEISKYPLVLMLCSNCNNLQLNVVVNPDILFKDYKYVSGTTETLRHYFDFFAYFAIERYKQFSDFSKSPQTVLDIACNDGSQLDSFKKLHLKTYGIDPAENLFDISSRKHIVECSYLEDSSFSGKKFDIITAQNVFAHTDDVVYFLKNCKRLLDTDGVLFIQTSQAKMVDNNEFDTIYHEHLSYFSFESIEWLAKICAMTVSAYYQFDIHGVSQVFVLKHQLLPENSQTLTPGTLTQDAAIEKYKAYKKNVFEIINNIKETVKIKRAEGYKIVGYGAAAKGMTVLGVTELLPDCIIDDNPLKVGCYAPMANVPIVAIDKLQEYSEDKILFIPLAWNFFKEIKSRIEKVRFNKDDLYLRYFPTVQLIEAISMEKEMLTV